MQSRRTNLTGRFLIGVAIAGMLGLGGRLIYINASNGPSLIAKAHRQQRSVIPLQQRRGLITDCQGRIVAGTLLRKSVFIDPSVLANTDETAETVARILGIDPAEISQDLLNAGERRFIVIRRGVSEEEAEKIKNANIYGLGLFDEPYRTYPMNETAAPLVGFVSRDGKGVSGLEYQLDDWLRGVNGVKEIIRDARRKAFWLAEEGYRPACDGYHVVLTVDAEIQAITERELGAAIEQYSAESGTAVVMNAKTGAVIAIASLPSFDPNYYTDYSPSLYRNRAITDPYEPGSIFKPFIAAAALAEKQASLGEAIDCELGLWQDGARTLHDHHPCGLLTFEQIIIKSSNIGMAKLGKRLGNEKMFDYVKAFGFGEKTGVNISGEDAGIVRPLHRWNTFSTTSLPMGQEIGVTTLQMARAFCVFANGGKLVQPHVLRAVLRADGTVERDYGEPPPVRQVLPPEIADIVRFKLLVPTVNEGTGTKAKLAGYQVFGKTGTAQIARKGGGGYERNAYVGSFIAGAPATDPELVVIVSIRHPEKSKGYYGGTIAAPAVREILGQSLAYLDVPYDKPLEVMSSAEAPPWD